jgi:hypothetical protein
MLDSDLAAIYGVSTKRLLEQVRRNLDRFPHDFAFRITREEHEVLRSQIATLKTGRGQHRKYLPYVFTEHGAIMAANVLNSRQARVHEYDVRGRRWIDCIGRMVMRPSDRESASQAAIVTILQRVMDVIDPPALPPPPRKPRIGFKPCPPPSALCPLDFSFSDFQSFSIFPQTCGRLSRNG